MPEDRAPDTLSRRLALYAYLERLLANLHAVNPGVRHMLVSARTGEGVDAFRDWLAAVPDRVAAAA